jgi:hypothetical protein
MSNPSNPADQDHPHEDALAALHGMQSGESNDAQDQPAENPSSPSSTGLVGMLSQGQLNPPPADIGSSRSGFATPVPRGKPQPKLPGSASQVAKKPGKFDTIGVAKEVRLPDTTQSLDTMSIPPAVSYRSQRKIPKPPDWWRAAIPVMYTVSSLLLLVSLWAAGACIAMLATWKGYPLIEFDTDLDAFTPASKVMAGVMLMCLPVSIAIGIMAIILGGKIKKYEKKVAATAAAAEAPAAG